MAQLKLGKYKRYKGKYYQVFDFALHTETREKLVLYKPLYDCPELKNEYGIRPFFVRPYSMFVEKVNINGIQLPRFEFIEELN